MDDVWPFNVCCKRSAELLQVLEQWLPEKRPVVLVSCSQ